MEKTKPQSKKTMESIFDPMNFYIISSLCKFFSIIFSLIPKGIKLSCKDQGLVRFLASKGAK